MIAPAFSTGLWIASSSWLRVRFGTRYCVALTASDSPWKNAQSPMKSDRMVMSTRTFSSRRRSASSKICTNCVASSRACVSPNSRAALAEAGEAEAKQFLELVNDQQQSPAVETVRFGERLTQAETRLTQPILDTVAAPGRFVGAVSPGKARKRLG